MKANEELLEMLMSFMMTELEECIFDHQGNCQEHMHFAYDGSCWYREYKEKIEQITSKSWEQLKNEYEQEQK